jgi:hypothetical protein
MSGHCRDGFRYAEPIGYDNAIKHRHGERSEAIHSREESVDCFVASLLAMTARLENSKE